ncbi:MAG: response regulator transcription factor [Chitinophagaceae bacterium]|nr:response regulator transcription factor [Chitinophagaceae bacterium]MBP6371798.1 response regulator transcription factor [Ferruginibacter sp.]MBK7307156.1 response regulator transcription factor [Chitinophagaceae bacterium]MBK8785410.1 response regulator transcription factor [Chitinophagaceae bacterium]MBK9484598.1 response regulator transcription factor [Chitinophagaceae bacterium]
MEIKPDLIYIADDHIMVAQGISSLLQQLGYSNIRIFTNGQEVIKACNAKAPSWIFLDIYMPEGDGISTLQQLRTKGYQIPIIMLSMTADKKYVDTSMEYGANAYLHKSCDAFEISKAITAIENNKKYISEAVNYINTSTIKVSINSEYYLKEALTKREVEILGKYCDGLTTEEIAQQLFLSIATVDTHKKNIMQKFGVGTLSKLVAVAIKNYFV